MRVRRKSKFVETALTASKRGTKRMIDDCSLAAVDPCAKTYSLFVGPIRKIQLLSQKALVTISPKIRYQIATKIGVQSIVAQPEGSRKTGTTGEARVGVLALHPWGIAKPPCSAGQVKAQVFDGGLKRSIWWMPRNGQKLKGRSALATGLRGQGLPVPLVQPSPNSSHN